MIMDISKENYGLKYYSTIPDSSDDSDFVPNNDIIQEFINIKGQDAPQFDDLTMLCVKMK